MIPTRIFTKTFYHHVLDCKTVRIFAYSSTREQSNKISGTRLKTETQTGEDWGVVLFSLTSHALRSCKARALHTRKTLTPNFTDFFTIFEKKTDCFAVYLITYSLNDFHSGYVVWFCIVSMMFKLLFSSRIM